MEAKVYYNVRCLSNYRNWGTKRQARRQEALQHKMREDRVLGQGEINTLQ